MLNNLNKEGIKVNAVVTDCAHQHEVASIFKTRGALKNFATKVEESNDEDLNGFPEFLLAYISNNEWWNDFMQLKTLLEPYMASLNKLQRDKENDDQSLDEDTEEEPLISLSENDMELENPGKQIQTNVSHFDTDKCVEVEAGGSFIDSLLRPDYINLLL
ncbi:1161_t:CDS:2, partial [Gigaspora margarita]